MLTSWDKALISGVGSIIFFLKYFGIVDVDISPENIAALIMAAMPFLVYVFPNIKK